MRKVEMNVTRGVNDKQATFLELHLHKM